MKKYENFCTCLNDLKNYKKYEDTKEAVIKQGVLSQLEITYDTSWKLMKWILSKEGVVSAESGSPKAILSLAYQYGIINEEETWIELHRDRNRLAHEYSINNILDIFDKVFTRYLPILEEVLDKIPKERAEE